ncbi:hypothetical protein [Arabiibacter massiliensis]|uniref:hypothetical protein n=1 Tax=Arabiibacter massiliensis TaxID=1870985 RepID=UPI0009BBD6B8|nr:hypothetical protein [Arabiibacter massiliensis]
MKLLGHFYGARRNVFLDYDFLHTVEGEDELRVRFTRFRGLATDYAETVVPACSSWDVEGFGEDELGELQRLLQKNMPLILEEAEQSRDGDADLVEMTFEIENELWVRFAQICYLEGISPEQGFVRALECFIEEFDARD